MKDNNKTTKTFSFSSFFGFDFRHMRILPEVSNMENKTSVRFRRTLPLSNVDGGLETFFLMFLFWFFKEDLVLVWYFSYVTYKTFFKNA